VQGFSHQPYQRKYVRKNQLAKMYENSWNTFKASKIMISKWQNASVDG